MSKVVHTIAQVDHHGQGLQDGILCSMLDITYVSFLNLQENDACDACAHRQYRTLHPAFPNKKDREIY